MIIPTQKLKELVIKAGLIDERVFDKAAADSQRLNQDVGDLLIAERLISEDYLLNLISGYLKIPRVRLRTLQIPQYVLNILPYEVAGTKRAIPFAAEGNLLKVAMTDPHDLETLKYLETFTKKQIQPFLASNGEINYGLSLYQKTSSEDLEKLIETESKRVSERKYETLEAIAKEVSSVSLVNNLINYAASLNASDIHFEVLVDIFLVRFRVDGVLREMLKLPKIVHPAVVARIKVLADLQIDEHQKPQDGRFRYKFGEHEFDIRVAIMPTLYGEKIVLRLLSALTKPSSFEDLGMNDDLAKILRENTSKAYGMILATGPTGSGKTTTLYTVLAQLNKPSVNIVTVEDPIEYEMRFVNQTQVNEKAGITFASGLRAFLRQDPNIMMVGEIRDKATADIAVQAALTGHVVLSTLHTNDAAGAIPRLIDLDVPQFLVSGVVNAVLAQRLVRKIHLECIESYELKSEQKELIAAELKKLGIKDVPKIPNTIYKGKGCKADGFTGYMGRVGIFEILDLDDEIKNYIYRKDFTLEGLKALARKKGMKTMFEDGLSKIEVGTTTIEEVLRVIRE